MVERWLSRDKAMLGVVLRCRFFEDVPFMGGLGLYMAYCSPSLYRVSEFIEAEEWHSREVERLEIMEICQPTGESKWKTL